jgi:hypothetical protein
LARRSQDRIDTQQADLAKRYAEALTKGMGGKEGQPSPAQAAALAAMGVPPQMIPGFVFGPETKTVTVDTGGKKEVLAVPKYGTGPVGTVYSAEVTESPDALLGARTSTDNNIRSTGVSRDNAVLAAGTSRANNAATVAATTRGQNLTAQTAATLASPELKGEQAAAQKSAEIKVERSEAQRKMNSVYDTYQVAMKGLVEGLDAASGAESGALLGRVPALGAGGQIADGAVAAVVPVLKELFRTAGEGVFTDKDQEALLAMAPKRSDYPEARKAKLANIDAIVRTKLKQGAPESIFNESAMSGGAMGASGGSVRRYNPSTGTIE